MKNSFDFSNPKIRNYTIASLFCIALAAGGHALLANLFPEVESSAFRAASLFVLAMSSGFLLLKNIFVLTDSFRYPQLEASLRRTIPLSLASLAILYLTDFDKIDNFENSVLPFLSNGAVRRFGYLILAGAAAFIGERIFSIEDSAPRAANEKTNRPGKALAAIGSAASCLVLMALSFEFFALPNEFAPNPIAGVNIIISGFLSALAMSFMIGTRTKLLKDKNEIFGMGRLIFGFSIFWAYVNFSEILISTYSLSAEGSYGRIAGYENFGRIYVSFLLCFAIPFVFLLARRAKSNPLLLRLSSVAIIHGSYITILRYFDYSLNLPTSIAIFAMTGWWALFWIGSKIRSNDVIKYYGA